MGLVGRNSRIGESNSHDQALDAGRFLSVATTFPAFATVPQNFAQSSIMRLRFSNKIAAPVGRCQLVADGVGEGHLGIMAWCSAFMFRAYPRDICLW